MSGTFPSNPVPSSVTMQSVYPMQSDNTQSGRRNVRQFGAQRWKLSLTFPDTLSKDQFMPIAAFMLKQKGGFETFQFSSPELATPRGVATGTPVVSGAGQTGTSIVTYGWSANVAGIMKAGDILKFAGHSKVYMVTDDANSDGSGIATLNIEPPLMESPANAESITVTGVEFTVMMNTQNLEYTVSGPLLFQTSLEFAEAL